MPGERLRGWLDTETAPKGRRQARSRDGERTGQSSAGSRAGWVLAAPRLTRLIRLYRAGPPWSASPRAGAARPRRPSTVAPAVCTDGWRMKQTATLAGGVSQAERLWLRRRRVGGALSITHLPRGSPSVGFRQRVLDRCRIDPPHQAAGNAGASSWPHQLDLAAHQRLAAATAKRRTWLRHPTSTLSSASCSLLWLDVEVHRAGGMLWKTWSALQPSSR